MPPAISPGGDRSGALNTVKAAGLVFGDIGTSPIYTLTVILALEPTDANVLGVLSLITGPSSCSSPLNTRGSP